MRKSYIHLRKNGLSQELIEANKAPGSQTLILYQKNYYYYYKKTFIIKKIEKYLQNRC